MKSPLTGALLLFAATTARLAADPADTLANPEPRSGLRELSTDRPDATESPFTVEPGRVQIEASVAAYARDEHTPERDGVTAEVWNVAPVNVRLGLTSTFELQFVWDNYLRARAEAPGGPSTRVSGFGDLTVRAKWNLHGNDEGGYGLGVMPFVKLPTADDDLGNGEVEGGVIVPVAFDLGGGWGFGAMTEIDWVRDAADEDYRAAWINTATVSRELTDRLGVFVELASEAGEGPHALSFNFGSTFAVSDDVQLDAGCYLGLTRAAVDQVVFAGITLRY